MMWYIVRREDNDGELGRTNSSIQAPRLAREKAAQYGTEVYIARPEAHEEDEGALDTSRQRDKGGDVRSGPE